MNVAERLNDLVTNGFPRIEEVAQLDVAKKVPMIVADPLRIMALEKQIEFLTAQIKEMNDVLGEIFELEEEDADNGSKTEDGPVSEG